MLTNIRYIFLTALRDWLFAALVIGVMASALIAHLLGSTAMIETQEMTLSYAGASMRVIIVTGLIIFVCFHIRNAFDTKEIDVFLSRPITRSGLIFSYWAGFAAVAVLLVIPVAALIAVQGIMDARGFCLWSFSLLAECWLMVAAALFSAFALKSAVTSTMLSMGFYVLSRMMGFFVAVSGSGGMFEKQWMGPVFRYSGKIASVAVPRLDAFSRSDWLVYGLKNSGELKLLVWQIVVLIPLLVLATIADFRRRQF